MVSASLSCFFYGPYITRISLEKAHKLMGFYMEGFFLLVVKYTVHAYCFFKLFHIGCMGLMCICGYTPQRDCVLTLLILTCDPEFGQVNRVELKLLCGPMKPLLHVL